MHIQLWPRDFNTLTRIMPLSVCTASISRLQSRLLTARTPASASVLIPSHRSQPAVVCYSADINSNQEPTDEPVPASSLQPVNPPLAPLAPPNHGELPPELQDLSISEDGFLIDNKTGKVINEFGATRFDVAVRAMRDELSPPEWVEDTERSNGNILGALFTFPRPYEFQFVCKPDERGRETLLSDVRRRVCGVCQVDEGSEDLLFVVKDRMGGKFLSISMTLTVRAPEIVTLVYDAMGSDQRVKMRF